eukprot:5541368-Prymnesium_polylepis.1
MVCRAPTLEGGPRLKHGHGVGTSPTLRHSPESTRCFVVNFSHRKTSALRAPYEGGHLPY